MTAITTRDPEGSQRALGSRLWALGFRSWALGSGLGALGGRHRARSARPLRFRRAEAKMARDHRKLRVFQEAHQLYRETRNFPRDEWFGIRAQLRRAAVSISSNLVEGSARRSLREYSSFVNISRASAAEVAYLVTLASELGYLSPSAGPLLQRRCDQLIPQLESLMQKLDLLKKTRTEREQPKPNA